MTLRRFAGLGALLSPQNPGPHLVQATTLDSGGTPRRHRAFDPLPLVAIPGLTSALCTLSPHLASIGDSFARDRWRLPGSSIRGST